VLVLKVCEAVLFMACSKGCWGVCSSDADADADTEADAAEDVFGRDARLRCIGASAGRAEQTCSGVHDA
jgi:hypothetical protein